MRHRQRDVVAHPRDPRILDRDLTIIRAFDHRRGDRIDGLVPGNHPKVKGDFRQLCRNVLGRGPKSHTRWTVEPLEPCLLAENIDDLRAAIGRGQHHHAPHAFRMGQRPKLHENAAHRMCHEINAVNLAAARDGRVDIAHKRAEPRLGGGIARVDHGPAPCLQRGFHQQEGIRRAGKPVQQHGAVGLRRQTREKQET